MSVATNIETVCTHAQLCDGLASGDEGLARMAKLVGKVDSGDGSTTVRERENGLKETLKRLAGITPPIYEGDLRDVTELRDAVIYAALARMYEEAMTSNDDVYATKAKLFRARFDSELVTLRPTLVQTGRGPLRSYPMGRR